MTLLVTKDDVQTFVFERRRDYLLFGTTPAKEYVKVGAYQYTSTRTGGKVDAWRWKIRHHQNAGSYLTGTKWKIGGGYGTHYGSFYIRSGGVLFLRYESVTGNLIQLFVPDLLTPDGSADQTARQVFYKRAKAKQTSFRTLTFLGELGETLRMLRNPTRALREGLGDYVKTVTKRSRRIKRSNRPALNRVVGDTWLEYTYGWAPLISDARGAAQALNERLERYQGLYAKVSSRGFERNFTQSSPQANFPADRILRRSVVLSTWRDYTVKYYGEVESRPKNSIQADMQLFGANWREVIPTAWELLPYSFLVDYFTNVGDVLDAWTFQRSTIAWCMKTVRSSADLVGSVTALPSDITGYGTIATGQPQLNVMTCSPLRVTKSTVYRNLTTPEVPSFDWKIPGFGRRYANMAALGNARLRWRKSL